MNIYKFHSFTVEGHKKRNKIRLKQNEEKLKKKNTCECREKIRKNIYYLGFS